MNYHVTIKVAFFEDSSDSNAKVFVKEKIDADTPLQALGILLRQCQQIPKALDAVDPKNPYREPA